MEPHASQKMLTRQPKLFSCGGGRDAPEVRHPTVVPHHDEDVEGVVGVGGAQKIAILIPPVVHRESWHADSIRRDAEKRELRT